MPENLYTHRDGNIAKTWLLMSAILIALIGLGWLLSQAYGNPTILYGFALFGVVGNVFSYWFSDKVALSLSGARPLPRVANERVYDIVENLCITAGLPMPPLYIIPGEQINAFATGRNPEHAAIAVTQGALIKLNDNELQGVLAHELSHIGNRDILISTIAVVLAGLIAVMSDWFLRMSAFGRGNNDNRQGNAVILIVALVAALLAPLAATMIRLAISRRREYLADASGALLTRYPDGLASALEKIKNDASALPTAHTATAHLFLSNPFRGRRTGQWLTGLFQTHPPLEDRIRILRGMH
jgi:heat shock protein HtpX